ncbi:hypothetical protein XAPC_308 [Xanthomonas citri pv. punicae str. LMG 859]|nr:hypothetical protein XAPC_308 [Xanthomonas citri pv. punicae str. LMG 859]
MRIASRRRLSLLGVRPAANASRRPESMSRSTSYSSAGVRLKSSGSRMVSGKYTVVRNCKASPKRTGTTCPSTIAAAAELLVPKSMPSFMQTGLRAGRALYYACRTCRRDRQRR